MVNYKSPFKLLLVSSENGEYRFFYSGRRFAIFTGIAAVFILAVSYILNPEYINILEIESSEEISNMIIALYVFSGVFVLGFFQNANRVDYLKISKNEKTSSYIIRSTFGSSYNNQANELPESIVFKEFVSNKCIVWHMYFHFSNNVLPDIFVTSNKKVTTKEDCLEHAKDLSESMGIKLQAEFLPDN